MRAHRVSALSGIALVGALVCTLAGCGSAAQHSSTATSPADIEAPTATDQPTGNPVLDCAGQDGQSCAYNGFDPLADGFGFKNWGSAGEIGATEMISLFGRDGVCASDTDGACVLYPAAQQWAAQVNEGMASGHCEGMAVLAARLHLGQAKLGDLDPHATSTFELDRDIPAVNRAIDLWWATQLLPPVQAVDQEFRNLRPSDIAVSLAEGLATGAGYTMAIYSENGGHSITPIGVTRVGGKFVVSAYDNNLPGTVQRIQIDPESERWSYVTDSSNKGAPTAGWTGGRGTIELTPMDSRQLPAEAPFTDQAGSGSLGSTTSQILVTTPTPGNRFSVLLRIGGRTYDTSDPMVQLPEGVSVHNALGARLAGAGLALAVDRSRVGAFTVTLRSSRSSGSAPVTMSIDDPRSPRITLRGDVPPGTSTAASYTVSANGRTTVNSSGITDARVNVSRGRISANFSPPTGVDMRIDPQAADASPTIDFIDDHGKALGSYELAPDSGNDAVVAVTANFNAKSGGFEVVTTEAGAAKIDDSLLPAFMITTSSDDDSENDSRETSKKPGSASGHEKEKPKGNSARAEAPESGNGSSSDPTKSSGNSTAVSPTDSTSTADRNGDGANESSDRDASISRDVTTPGSNGQETTSPTEKRPSTSKDDSESKLSGNPAADSRGVKTPGSNSQKTTSPAESHDSISKDDSESKSNGNRASRSD